MGIGQRTRQLAAGVVALALAGGPVVAGDAKVGSSDQAPGAAYVVVLRSGQRVASNTKPISALGSVRFVDAQGRARVLTAAQVDLAKTRDANRGVAPTDGAGTFSVAGGVTVSEPAGPAGAGGLPVAASSAPAPSIVVYSATWCGPCRMLRQYLAENGIAADVTEVDTLSAAEQERVKTVMKRLTGTVAYPTVVIGTEARTGFSPEWIRSKLGR